MLQIETKYNNQNLNWSSINYVYVTSEKVPLPINTHGQQEKEKHWHDWEDETLNLNKTGLKLGFSGEGPCLTASSFPDSDLPWFALQ